MFKLVLIEAKRRGNKSEEQKRTIRNNIIFWFTRKNYRTLFTFNFLLPET